MGSSVEGGKNYHKTPEVSWALLMLDSKALGLYIDKEKWIIELCMQIWNEPYMCIKNIKELLETPGHEAITLIMEKSWKYLVWITSTEWDIPSYLIEYIWDEKKIRNEWEFEKMDDDPNDLSYMIFMEIPWMNSREKTEKIKQTIKLNVEWIQQHFNEENDDIYWLNISKECEWIYPNHQENYLEIIHKYTNPLSIRKYSCEIIPESMEEVELAEKIKQRWYYLASITEPGELIPDYITKEFWNNKWHIIIHDRIPAMWDEKLIFIFYPTLTPNKHEPLYEEEIAFWEEWLKGFSIYDKNKKLKEEPKILIMPWTEWIWIDPETQELSISKIINRDELRIFRVKDLVKHKKEIELIEKLEKDWLYFVWFTEDDLTLPKYLWEMLDLKKTKFLKHTRFWDHKELMLFTKIPWINRKIDIQNNIMSKEIFTIKEWVQWLYINKEKWLIEMVLVGKNNWKFVVWDIKKMLRNATEELFVRTQETLWYFFVWITDKDWNYPEMVKEAIDLKKNKHFPFPRAWDNSWVKLIFAQIPGMPKPKETYEELCTKVENEENNI